jgi:hypothetical protein
MGKNTRRAQSLAPVSTNAHPNASDKAEKTMAEVGTSSVVDRASDRNSTLDCWLPANSKNSVAPSTKATHTYPRTTNNRKLQGRLLRSTTLSLNVRLMYTVQALAAWTEDILRLQAMGRESKAQKLADKLATLQELTQRG